MTLDEIKQELSRLNEEERLRVMAFLRHLSRTETEENQAQLSERMRQISDGNYVTLDQLLRVHESMTAENL